MLIEIGGGVGMVVSQAVSRANITNAVSKKNFRVNVLSLIGVQV